MSGVNPRDAVVGAVLAFLAGQDLLTLAQIRAGLEAEIDRAGPDALTSLLARLRAPGDGWRYEPPEPLARRIHHVLADSLLHPDSDVAGLTHLADLGGAPTVVVANHLSYADANLFEILLHRAGGAAITDRLTVMAGPKVYTSRQRHFSSLCFGTIRTPQNADIASEEASMNAREVARAARQTIDAAHARLRAGDALLVFAEGTRSRSGAMQPLLAGATRYLDEPRTIVVPAGLTGTEALFPIGDERLHPVRITVSIGRPIAVDELRQQAAGDRRRLLDAVGRSIAALLPAAYRGVYQS